MLARCQEWKTELERIVPGGGRVNIELDPDSEPLSPDSMWNWFLSFEFDGQEFEALVDQDLSAVAFEDGSGIFDDHVKFDDLPAYLARRIK
jgi:hypothetical protein